jgi:membrane-associated phospholipid phosphatase
LGSLDEQLLLIARTRAHSPGAERAVSRFSRLGEHAGIWLAIGAVGSSVDRSRGGSWRRATGAVALVYALNTAIKRVVRRRRPTLAGLPPLTDTPSDLSFPSAHASSSFAGALVYSRLGLPAIPLYALAGGLSLSRLYLGVHYPSDVLAGALLGTALGRLLTRRAANQGAVVAGVSPAPRSENGSPSSARTPIESPR